MPLSDDELEQLDARLDGALDPTDAAALDARIAREPELAAAMEGLRADRALLGNFFRALEPDDAAADALASRVCTAAFRAGAARPLHAWRWYAAVAACLLIGFGVGWSGRARVHPAAGIVANNNPVPASSNGGAMVETIVSYQVALTDESGHVTAVQTFDSLSRAQEFAHDVRRWQDRRAELRAGTAPVVVADRF